MLFIFFGEVVVGGEELGGAVEGVFAEWGIVEEAVVLVGGEVVFGGVFELLGAGEEGFALNSEAVF